MYYGMCYHWIGGQFCYFHEHNTAHQCTYMWQCHIKYIKGWLIRSLKLGGGGGGEVDQLPWSSAFVKYTVSSWSFHNCFLNSWHHGVYIVIRKRYFFFFIFYTDHVWYNKMPAFRNDRIYYLFNSILINTKLNRLMLY